jgi:membrane-bound lytic murein transglycosylase D
MKLGLLYVLLLCMSITAFGQTSLYTPPEKGDRYLQTIEESLNLFYAEYSKNGKTDSIIDALNYEPGEIPEFSDDEYCARLSKINNLTPFQLECNTITLSSIRFFAANRRSFCRVALGRAKLYFPLYEEMLAKHKMPLELKYLSVIESGLRPQVKSGAGALGLWQFMYRTGVSFGLNENSYIDERMDPVKATDAACRYLKQLYNMYNDWNLALAAYNAGPGNVNKAIRRSGGKRTYWEVRPFLPRETQGYVPNLMTYHAEHNIVPAEAKVNNFQLDTICLHDAVHMNTLAEFNSWDLEEIKALNPIYKTEFIPKTSKGECISGPLMEISKLAGSEDSLYALEERKYNFKPEVIDEIDSADVVDNANAIKTRTITHKIVRGETMTTVANKYNTTLAKIMKENRLRSARVKNGQLLKVTINEKEIEDAGTGAGSDPESEPEPLIKPKPKVEKPKADAPEYKIYKVRRGDTAPKIASKFGITQKELLKINGLRSARLRSGTRLKVPASAAETEDAPEEIVDTTPKGNGGSKPLDHVVKKGETLSSIGRKYNVSNTELVRINKLKSESVKVGQRIKLIDFGADDVVVEEEPKDTPADNEPATIISVKHKVKSKETLNSIAKLYGVNAADIMKWNELPSTKLYVGQSLKIEGVEEAISDEPESIKKPDPKKKVEPKKKYYSVRSGETLAAIARKHSLTQGQLAKLNPGIKPNRITVGQSIRVK